MKLVGAGEVVQIGPLCVSKEFQACFAIVAEVCSWGVKAYVQSPGYDKDIGTQVFLRLEWSEFSLTGGKAVWVI